MEKHGLGEFEEKMRRAFWRKFFKVIMFIITIIVCYMLFGCAVQKQQRQAKKYFYYQYIENQKQAIENEEKRRAPIRDSLHDFGL